MSEEVISGPARKRRGKHPLRMLFMAARFTTGEGMNWLADHGLISDNCLEPEDIDRDAVIQIFELAAFSWNPKYICALRDAYEKSHPET